MFGILLTAFGTLADEVSTSIGKWEVTRGRESIFTMGFLSSLWGAVFLLVLAFLVPKGFFAPGFPGGFVFNMASLPTFMPRVLLEILQAYVTVYAIAHADRSTYGFLRIITIPLLLVTDILLSYSFNLSQIAGMTFIIASLFILFMNHGIRRQGAGVVLFIAVNAVITISLYKYDITLFNFIEAEQSIVSLVLLVFFFFMAFTRAGENPLRLLARPVFFFQSLLSGVSGAVTSFAYLFGTASIITTALRAFSVLFAMLSGHFYFREKKLWIKISVFSLITVGLVLLAL